MVDFASCISNRSFNIFGLQIRHLFQNLPGGKAASKQVKDIYNTNPHSTNAGTTTTLFRVKCYSISPV
jgi:hypothetical protein